LAYRMDPGATVLLAKYDHAAQYESHGGANAGDLYGGRDKSYADAVAAVIENDPPSGLAESGTIGGFKVVQSDQHQVVYGADADRICTYRLSFYATRKSFYISLLSFENQSNNSRSSSFCRVAFVIQSIFLKKI
jgi:hypothetical protein